MDLRHFKTRNGFDKLIRLIQWLSLLVASALPPKLLGFDALLVNQQSARFRAFSRVLDNIPALRTTLSYGFGKDSETVIYRVLQVLENVSFQIYFPTEHLALFSELELIPFDKNFWTVVCIGFWGLGLFSSVNRNLFLLYNLYYQAAEVEQLIINQRSYNQRLTLQLRLTALRHQQKLSALDALRDASDWIIAVHCFYPGFLWAGQVKSAQLAVLGVISSCVYLYKLQSETPPTETSVQ